MASLVVVAQPGGPVVVVQPDGLPVVTVDPPAPAPITVIQQDAAPVTVLQPPPPAPVVVVNPGLGGAGLDLDFDRYGRLILNGGPPALTNGA